MIKGGVDDADSCVIRAVTDVDYARIVFTLANRMKKLRAAAKRSRRPCSRLRRPFRAP